MNNLSFNDKELIKSYLKDDVLLYKQWYLKKIGLETGISYGEPVSVYNNWENAFLQWIEENKKSLVQLLCPKKEEILQINDAIDIIANIAFLIKNNPAVFGVYETASLLFKFGIKKLCKENVQ